MNRATHAENRPVEIDVLASGELGMKASADLEQAGNATGDGDAPVARLGDARQDLQERGLAGAVAADDPENLTFADLEADILQGPERLCFLAFHAERMPQAVNDCFLE